MILILVRHGIAEDATNGSDSADAARPLTEKGRRKVRSVAKQLAALELPVSHVVTSHRLRAIQTAEELIAEIDPTLAMQQSSAMDMDASWPELVAALNRLTNSSRSAVIVAVGHLPSIGLFLSAALTGSGEDYPFRKGAAVVLEWDPVLTLAPGRFRAYLADQPA
jgi:phosphohistidine phosphatase